MASAFTRAPAKNAGMCADPDEIARVTEDFGLAVLNDDAVINEGRALAARLIDEAIAPADMFRAVQRKFPASLFGYTESGKLTGLLAAFPVNARGADLLAAGTYEAVQIDLSLVCAPGEIPGAYYGWGFAASTKDGGRAVVKASLAIQQRLYWATPVYARAVTADGVRALTSIGFAFVGPQDPHLLWIAPRPAQDEAAA